MSRLSIAHKIFLEATLGMQDGNVLDFTGTTFAQLFDDVGVDIFDDQYAENGPSKANRLRELWRIESDAVAAQALNAFADYIEGKMAVGSLKGITEQEILGVRQIAQELAENSPTPARGGHITTEATATSNRVPIEINEDIYTHIEQYLASGNYFHAVDESYKLVREKLREITGHERASDAFKEVNYKKLFGHEPTNKAERDFFEGVKYLNMAIQFLRNEKAHTPAMPLESTLAIHYISLASLSYDLITRHVSDEVIHNIEEIVRAKRSSYSTATAFYRDFKDGNWMKGLTLPESFTSATVRGALKAKWLQEADFTISYDQSNIVLMQLELIADDLTQGDLDQLLDLPTHNKYGKNQQAGMLDFLEYIEQNNPGKLSAKAKARISDLKRP